jgi:hypothetical protein
MTADAWDRDYAVNVRSHMLFAQKALTMMAPGGAIVLTSSMASQRANGRNPAYESSKAAQIALGRAIARAGEEKRSDEQGVFSNFAEAVIAPLEREGEQVAFGNLLCYGFGHETDPAGNCESPVRFGGQPRSAGSSPHP